VPNRAASRACDTDGSSQVVLIDATHLRALPGEVVAE
jgi:hypothetical protein